MRIFRLFFVIIFLKVASVFLQTCRNPRDVLGRKAELTRGRVRNDTDAASLHPVSKLLLGQGDQPENIIIYKWWWGAGMGSTTLWIMLFTLFFQETQNRRLVLDESQSKHYWWDNTNGLYSSLFRLPRIPVINSASEYQLIKEQISLLGGDRADILYPFSDAQLQNHTWMSADSELLDPNLPSVMMGQGGGENTRFGRWREAIGKHYGLHQPPNPVFFDKFSRFVCDNLDWLGSSSYSLLEDNVAGTVRRWSGMLLAQTSMPDLAGGYKNRTPGMEDKEGTESVAFHIRHRPDKLPETEYVDADRYVAKFRSVMLAKANTTSPEKAFARIKHCFVATDDYAMVPELIRALQDSSVPCEVYTLAKEDQQIDPRTGGIERNSREENIRFMTEMKLLVDATYFVGTFSSNIGTLVSLLRGCDRMLPESDPNAIASRLNHYYDSYSVDLEDWSICAPPSWCKKG